MTILLALMCGSAGAASAAVRVSILSPSSGQTVSGSITWEASASRAERVAFAIDGVPKWNEFLAPYVFNGDGQTLDTTTLSNGSHTLSVTGYYKIGRPRSASVTVTISNKSQPAPPPTAAALGVATKSPAAGATVSRNVSWEATVTSGTASRVDFTIDGSVKWTQSHAPYVFGGVGNTLDTTTLSNGSHQLTAIAYGASGASAKTTLTVTVANAPTMPLPTATGLPAITGNAIVGNSLASSTGTWSGSPTAYGYQWQRCDINGAGCTSIAGTTAAGYPVSTSDQGGTLRVTVTASNTAGSGSASSVPTAAVAAAATNQVSTLGSSLPSRLPQSSGAGGTYYVDGTNGSDSGNGSSSSPWKMINKALATVPLSGSIIKVLPGTYYSQGTNYAITFTRQASTSDPITLQAQTPGTVVIANADPSSWTLGGWVRGASGLRLQGLVFRIHATASLNKGSDALLIENSSRIEVANCTINEVGTEGLMVRGGLNSGETSNDIWFLNNVFRSSSSNIFSQVTGTGWSSDQYFGSKGSHWIYSGQYGTDANGWDYTNGSRRLVVTNNVFTGTTAGRDIELGPQSQNSYIVNNTFFGNHVITLLGSNTLAAYAGGAVEVFTGSQSVSNQTGGNVIANNLFVDLDGHAVYGSGPSERGNVVSSNLSFGLRNGLGNQDRTNMDYEPSYNGGSSTLFTLGANLPDTDPSFVNPTGFDFHLAAGSPARGAANPAYSYPSDADGAPRPSAPAVGALG